MGFGVASEYMHQVCDNSRGSGGLPPGLSYGHDKILLDMS